MDFHTTVMGHRFFESHVPAAIEEVRQLNKVLRDLVRVMQASAEHAKRSGADNAKPTAPIAEQADHVHEAAFQFDSVMRCLCGASCEATNYPGVWTAWHKP